MSLQDIYYIFSIVFMLLGIIILIIIGYVLIVIKNRIEHLHDLIDQKISILSKYASDPGDTALQIGSKVANVAVRKVREALSKK